MNNASPRARDLMAKISSIAIIAAIFYLIYSIKNFSFIQYYKEFINVKIYNIIEIAAIPSLLIFLLILLSLFFSTMLNSKHNNSKLEKLIYFPLKKIEDNRLKVNVNLYTIIVSSMYGLLMYILIDFLITMSLIVIQTPEVDYIKMDAVKISGYSDKTYLISYILLFFSFLFFTKPNKKMNKYINIGSIIIPLFTMLFSFSFNLFPFVVNEDGSIIYDSGIDFFSPLFFIIAFVFILIYYLTDNDELKSFNKIGYMSAGYIMSMIFYFIAICLIEKSPMFEYSNKNLNYSTISINEVEYKYNKAAIMTHPDNINNKELEYLIKAYAGYSMHTTVGIVKPLFSVNYEGDKELAYQLFAKVYQKNSIIVSENREKLFEIMKNEVYFADFVPLIIQDIIYENLPYKNTKRTIESVLNKDYQKAIDYYIEDALNDRVPNIYKYTGSVIGENGKQGSDLYQDMIASIIYNGHAVMDVEKITSPKMKKFWTNRINNKSMNLNTEIYDKDHFNKVFKVFDIK